MSRSAIFVNDLTKQYRIGERQRGYATLRDTIVDGARSSLRHISSALHWGKTSARPSRETITALDHVTFEVPVGQVFGVIGRNGAGKSTLLKLLARITEPTQGFAEIRGRVGSLLEVGTGFHPELTGRENIFLNGVILGMTRAEITRKFDDIVAFAEVEKFVDTPVKHYSSGMYLRLAFSVAAHLEPEILLVDEVLAVGDARFQSRCIHKMKQVAHQGRTILFVSHNMAAVRQLCSSAILLSAGGIEAQGETEDVVRAYLATTYSDTGSDLIQIPDRNGAGEIRLTAIRFEDQHGQPAHGLISGQPGHIVLNVSSEHTHEHVQACVAFLDSYGQRLMYLNSYFLGEDMPYLPMNGELVCEIPRVHLAPGQYRLELWVKSGSIMQDRLSNAGTVDVVEGNFFKTGRAVASGFQVALMDFDWKVRDARYRVDDKQEQTASPSCASQT